MYDAVLFDLDGTLIDTEAISVLTGRKAFAALGHAVTPEFMHGMIGKDGTTTSRLIVAAMPRIDVVRLNSLWAEGFRAAIQDSVPLKPHAHRVLAGISLPRAIVTSSRRHEATTKLGLASLAGYFDEVIVVDDVAVPKPAPDAYLLAARRLGVSPARCLVFEDSETGAESAHRAGCVVVQVPDILPTAGRWAHHVAPDLLAGATLAGLHLGHSAATIDGAKR
ncbi:MAG: HAD family phosphatase [Pseudomonadota bacterium]